MEAKQDFCVNAIVFQTINELVKNDTPPSLNDIEIKAEEAFNFLLTTFPNIFTEEHKTKVINKIIAMLKKEFVVVVFGETVGSISNEIKYEKISSEEIAEASYYWEKYKTYKLRTRTPSFITAQSRDVDRILKMMPSPIKNVSFQSFGMVIGDVQAGKTGNYSVLINKAADIGYKLIIVLTGMTENLRSQTQKRLDEDFVGATSEAGKQSRMFVGVGTVGPHEPSRVPTCITDQSNDFKKRSVANFILESQNSPVVIVTKKNSSILSNILNFLSGQTHGEKIQDTIRVPTLIIDDESDNASVDTAKEDEDPKAINKKIRLLVNMCNQVSYVAYTATPYANIFIDPDLEKQDSESGVTLVDLYPKDFIVALKAPSNYCGGDFFYSDDPDIKYADKVKVLIEDAGEENAFPLKHTKKDIPTILPKSLKKAIFEFFLAIAIKSIRRKKGRIPLYDKHDSMLINVSRFTDYQNETHKLIDDFVQSSVLNKLYTNPEDESESSIWQQLKLTYLEHYQVVIEDKVSWKNIKQELVSLIQENPNFVEIVAIHSQSKDELLYGSEPKRYIAIGGFKLSRGLTLEGLTISYFYRKSIMYDTLMQMARWFGYRDGFKDLVRLYTTKECASWYDHINKATIELKEYLVVMERQKKEPSEFGIKVRSTEEALIVTSLNKMRSTEELDVGLDFSGKCVETFYVDPRPERALYNIEKGKEFVSSLRSKFQRIHKEQQGAGFIAKDISGFAVNQFLRRLNIHNANVWARGQTLISFINDNIDGMYGKWDIALLDVKGNEGFDFCEGVKVGVAKRSTSFQRDLQLPNPRCKEDNKYKLPLGDNGRVSSAGMEATGLFKEDCENFGISKKVDGRTHINDSAARQFRAERRMNPLLVLQIVDIRINDKAKVSDRKSHVSDLINVQPRHLVVYLSLPGIGNANVKKYRVNRNFVKDWFGELEQDD
jgi:hypothetical protein